MNKQTIVLIGAAGNVGCGIFNALEYTDSEILPVDPQINQTIEDFSDIDFKDLIEKTDMVIYAAESGNRDEYEADSELWVSNNLRFAEFCEKAAKIKPNLKVWYIGGSWTKRQPNKDWRVSDESPNKNLETSNKYELAKNAAEQNAERMSKLLPIRFVDWISIVPNLAPNFTISKMIFQAIKDGKIDYSSGNFGRPLLDAKQAGCALITLIENDDDLAFKKYLIPGDFVKFEEIAYIVKVVVESKINKKIKLEEIPNTLAFLSSRCESKYLESIGFKIERKSILDAIKQNAEEILETLENLN